MSGGYAAYLRDNGFEVEVKITNELAQVSSKAGIPEEIAGCHTMFVDGYVVDGLVPVQVIRKLLTERPAVIGITLPGMPVGAPGCPAKRKAPSQSTPSLRTGRLPPPMPSNRPPELASHLGRSSLRNSPRTADHPRSTSTWPVRGCAGFSAGTAQSGAHAAAE
jgi:hypothetical protein